MHKVQPNLEFSIKKGEGSDLVAYTDSDFAGDLNDRTSILDFVLLLSSGAISWSSKK